VIPLVARSFGHIAVPFWATAALFALFQVGLVAVAASLAKSGEFDRLASMVPAVFQAAFAPALSSFGHMTLLGYFDPLIVMFLSAWAIYAGTEPAAEVEDGVVDLVLARPVTRATFVTRALIVTMGSTLGVTLLMTAGTLIALVVLSPGSEAWPDVRLLVLMVVHLTLVGWCFGAAAVAVSGWTRRRAAAMGIVTITAGAMYLVDFLGLWWKPLENMAKLTPYYYFHGGPLILGTARPVLNLTVLAVVTVVAIAVAYRKFEQRDL